MSDFPGNGTAEDMEMVRFVTNRNVLIRPNPEAPGIRLGFAEDNSFVGLVVACKDGPHFAISREAALQMADVIRAELDPEGFWVAS